ncbi:MAG TPA: lipopolysaccharide biosynthesis protein [Chitinophagaceae bacterium]
MRVTRLISRLNNKHFFSLAGNVIMSVFTLVTMSILYRFLPDKASIGNWVFFQTVFALVDLFRTGFLTTATIKFYSGADKDRAAEIIGSTWVLGSLITLGLLVLNLPALLLVKWVHIEGLSFFLKWFGVSYLCTLPIFVANCVLQAEARFDRLLYMRAITQFSFLGLLLALILMHHLTLEAVIIANLLSYLVTSLFVLLKGWTHITKWRRKTRRGILELYNFGKYSVAGNISSNLLRTSDIFIISFMFAGKLGVSMVAVYNLGLRLMEVIEIPLRSFIATAMPSLATAYNNGRKDEVIYIMKKYAGVITFALIPVCLGSVIFADLAVYIIGGKKWIGTEAATILRMFMIFALLFPTDRFIALTLDVIHKPNINFIKILVMLLANVIGDFAAIAIFRNVSAVAFSTLFPALLGVFIGYHFLKKYRTFHLRDIYVLGYAEIKTFIRDNVKLKRSVNS